MKWLWVLCSLGVIGACVVVVLVVTESDLGTLPHLPSPSALFSTPIAYVVEQQAPIVIESHVPEPSIGPTPIVKKINQEVPFTIQAPTGNWADPVYQNACEEASVLMAMRWVNGRSLNVDEALQEIQSLSDYSLEHFGYSQDLSAQDTVRLIAGYYRYSGAKVVHDVTVGDIKRALAQGNVVIVPANGRLLLNPYYVAPGPLQHMLVITGFDAEMDEFITNDPGTKHGQGYRYSTSVLLHAIRDYPTGNHEPIDVIKKVMIAVEPRLQWNYSTDNHSNNTWSS